MKNPKSSSVLSDQGLKNTKKEPENKKKEPENKKKFSRFFVALHFPIIPKYIDNGRH